ncbi:MAG: hypothetical protein AAGF93_00550 [Cyanobacteria bacterium P01_H01_bin.105]
MPAPSFVPGIPVVSDWSGYTTTEVTGNLENFGPVSSQSEDRRLRLGGSTTQDGLYFIDIAFPQVDATNTIWHTWFEIRANVHEGKISLRDASDNIRTWDLGYETNFRTVDILWDTRNTNYVDTGPGTFDISQVVAIRYNFTARFNGNFNNGFFQCDGVPYRYNADTGGALVGGGESGLPLSIADLTEGYINYPAGAASVTFFGGVGLAFQSPVNVVLGDATTEAVSEGINLVYFRTAAITPDFGRTPQSNVLSAALIIGFSNLATPGWAFVNFGLGFKYVDRGGGNTHNRLGIEGSTTVELGDSDYINSSIKGATGLTTGGKDNVAIAWENCAAPTTYQWGVELDPIGNPGLYAHPDLSGSSFDCPDADHYIDLGDNFADGATFDASNIAFTRHAGLTLFRLDAPGKILNLFVGTSGVTADDVEIIAGTLNIVATQSTIRLFGIPDVPNAVLMVEDLADSSISYPTLTNGEATITVDPARNYRVRAKAPGYLASSFVTLSGSTPSFEFSLENFRDLYDSGVDRSSQIAFDMATYEVVVRDDSDLNFADVFRTLENYLSTQLGILLPYPPQPVIVDLGAGSTRNYLFFPYDDDLDQVNPTRIKPDPANISDPTLLDFVIILKGASAPLFDIFDFTQAGGRTIRFQTDSVAALVEVSGSGALTTEQAQSLITIRTATDRLNGLIEDSGGDRFTTKALEGVSGVINSALTSYGAPTRTELSADIGLVIARGDTAWVTASGFPSLEQLEARTLPAAGYFDPSTNAVIASNMRGTDNALTSFLGLPNVTIGEYASGQSPADLVTLDLSTVAQEATAQTILDRTNQLPLLSDMENSSALTSDGSSSGEIDLDEITALLGEIQSAIARVAADAKAAKNFAAGGL